MTQKQVKLIENYVRMKVRKMLNESRIKTSNGVEIMKMSNAFYFQLETKNGAWSIPIYDKDVQKVIEFLQS